MNEFVKESRVTWKESVHAHAKNSNKNAIFSRNERHNDQNWQCHPKFGPSQQSSSWGTTTNQGLGFTVKDLEFRYYQ